MAYTKDLGNVKGDDGDVYLPDIKIQDGMLYYTWEKKSPEEIESILATEKRINIPVYVPTTMNNNGDVTFSLTTTVRDINGNVLPDKTFHLKGDKGDTGNTAFHIYHVTQNSIYEIPSADITTDTIYVKGTKAWIYDETEQDFFMMEGIDLSDYYRKSETYSQTEINTMFAEVTSQAELILKLLDVENIVLN